MTIDPGQSGTLFFDIDLRMRKGEQRFVCQLLQDTGAMWTYALETAILQRAAFEGNGIIHFGLVEPRAKVQRAIVFEEHGKAEGDLTNPVAFETTCDTFSVEPKRGPCEKAAGFYRRRWVLSATLTSPPTPGFGHAIIRAKMGANSKPEDFSETTVTWNVRSLFSVEPRQLFFGEIAPGDSLVRRKLVITGDDGSLLELRANCANPAIKISSARLAHNKVELLVTLEPKELRESLSAEITAETNDPRQPSLQIPIGAIWKL